MSFKNKSIIFDLNLEELDDKEFLIPSIDGPLPTLESILKETDIESIASDIEFGDNSCNDLCDSISTADNSSIASYDSKVLKCFESANTAHIPKREIFHGSILKHKLLRGMSSQLRSANTERSNAGKPSVITMSTCYVAIGTSHGFVLVFDLKQVLKWCLCNDNFGSVSAISIKRDNSRLISGYSRGHVSLWNLQTGLLLKTYTDLHSPQTTVLHLKYLSDQNFAALSDSSGSVFTLDFRRKDVDSQCIFSGSRGEVLTIEPLLLPINAKGNALNFSNICLLSMATVTKVIAISIRPAINIQFSQLLKGDYDTLPLLCWQFVLVQVSEEERVIDPVLAFARQSEIFFYQASFKTNNYIFFMPLIHLRVDYILQNITWINSRTLVTIDNLEKMHLIDVKSEEELEIIDIDFIEMVYGSAHYKSLATGGLVSAAMATAGQRACYHSICVSNSSLSNISSAHLLILGTNSVHSFVIRSWYERIDLLIKENKFQMALSMALSFYEDKAKAVVGLSGKKQEKRSIIGNKMMEILDQYVDTSLTKMCPEMGKIQILIDHYKQLIPVCIDYSIAIEQQDLIFCKLFDKLSTDAISKNIFLDCLEPYILNGHLKSLNPLIVQELVNHCSEKQMYSALEAIITHLEITTLDIHQIMTICRKHYLFDAIFYIHIQAFEDYITPFDELLRILQSALTKQTQLNEFQINLGNKLLLYVSCCLTGRNYPHNSIISIEKKSIVIKEILERITKYKSNNESNTETIYPNLRTLLLFDILEFLNVLTLAFDDFDVRDTILVDQKQKIVDILVRIVVESPGFSRSQIGCLFIFLARILSKKNNTIVVNKLILDDIIEYLTSSEDENRFEERQQSLLNLVQAEKSVITETEKILTLADNAKFYRVCEYIYVKNKKWAENMCCYLKDPYRKHQVFPYITHVMMNFNEREKTNFIDNIVKNVDKLTEIDNHRTANLLIDYIHKEKEFELIIKSLENNRKVLYRLLYGILLNNSHKHHKKDLSTSSVNFESLSIRDQRKQTLVNNTDFQEKFLELMCEIEPHLVHKTLALLDNYRWDNVLQMCKNSKINEAIVYLLEKNGNYDEAFQVLFNDFDGVIKNMNSSNIGELLIIIKEKLMSLINFCQRCSDKIVESKDRETLWFTLLESMLLIKQIIKSIDKSHPFHENYSNNLKELTDNLLNGMIGHIDLLTLLQRIINDPLYNGENSGKLCDIRELLMGMLDTYNYQETLLQTTNNLLLNDLHQQLSNLRKDANKANSNRSLYCTLCSKPLCLSDNVIVFNCCHSFHEKCINLSDDSVKCQLCDISGLKNADKSVKSIANESSHSDICDNQIEKFYSSSLKLDETQLKAIEYLKNCQRIDSKILKL